MGVLCPNNRRKEKVGMGKSRVNKAVAMILVFMMMFSNFGYTISAIATSDGFEVITNGFFEKEEVKFEAYFEEDGKKKEELISDVNKTIKLKMKLEPNVEGYLKEANVKFVDENGESPNFKIKDIKPASIGLVNEPMTDMLSNLGVKEEAPEEKAEENVVEENAIENSANNEVKEDIVEESAMSNSVVEEKVENVVENTVENTISEENVVDNTVVENTASEDTNTVIAENIVDENVVEEPKEEIKEDEKVEEQKEEPVVEEEPQPEAPLPQEEDVLIDEEKVIEEKTSEAEEEQIDFASDEKVVSDNEVKIINVIEETEYIVEIEFVQGEELEIADLYKEIRMQLTGTFINSDLEEVDVAKEEKVTVGWKYSKDIEITSEYTKVSPFKICESQGTIVENKITVKRNVEDEKYLPVKETRLNVTIPTFNDKTPIEVNVIASKLLATRGEDIGEVVFGVENWKYDKESGKIEIIVANEKEGKAVNSFGEDEYTIIYRFEDYTEDITSKLGRNVVVRVEEYSAKENNVIEKEIKDNQEIGVNVGELVTYSIDTSEEKVEKSRVYANYNSEEALYETEYRSNVTVNILTSDMLEKLKIEASKEFYKDINGNSFKAEGIKYKNIKFNYSDVKNILQKGGNIEVYTTAGELVYTLDNNLIKTEEDCIININYADGIVVYVNNIAVNGTIHFEMTKVIKKCNYDKAAFKNFTEIESRINAEVKYSNIDQTLALEEIKVAKGLKESYTRANVYINKENLSTIQQNENVELKIELNNDKEDSDLYVNPSFEFVFPKYVKEVNVESINLLYENGLRVSDFETYVESDIVKMRVELTGVQTTFSESSITNGTNILINVKIRVDEYTPSKEDQIKLYYCNEGVSNYESQTKWTISKQIPNGILKTTNGFDVAVFKYQAPNGMVAINGIRNYDGNLSEIKSVRQGDTTEEIPMNDVSRIATMDLLTLNNTGNECTDVVLIGRIPFKGNKDVITGEDLETTTTGVMKDFIKEDIQNFNMSTIYYSTNEKANKSLEDGANGWRLAEYVENINEVKSYMIVVKGSVAPGTVLKYNYDFEIPENLPYEVSMVGSFGAYYNNNTDVAVVYESTIADKVGVTTEAGPRVEATLDVDIGNGTEVGEARFLEYTIKVKNTGSMTATNIEVTNPVPNYTMLYRFNANNGYGNNNYVASNDKLLKWNIEKLEPGEEKEFKYILKTLEIPDVKEYYALEEGKTILEDENGYYYEKIINIEYVEKEIDKPKEGQEGATEGEAGEENEEVEDKEIIIEEKVNKEKVYVDSNIKVNIKNKANIKVSNLAIERDSNEVINPLTDSNFDIEVNTEWQPTLSLGSEFAYMSTITNISGENKEHVKVVCDLPKTVKYVKPVVYMFSHEQQYDVNNVIYDEKTHTVTFHFSELYADETINAYVRAEVVSGNNEMLTNYFTVITEDGRSEVSSPMTRLYAGPGLEVKQMTNLENNFVLEQEEVEFVISIKNIGNYKASNLRITDAISQNLTDVKARVSGSSNSDVDVSTGTIDTNIGNLPNGEEVILTISGKAAELKGIAKTISNKASIFADYIDKVETDTIEIVIKDNPNKVEEKEEELPLDHESNGQQQGSTTDDSQGNNEQPEGTIPDTDDNKQEENKKPDNSNGNQSPEQGTPDNNQNGSNQNKPTNNQVSEDKADNKQDNLLVTDDDKTEIVEEYSLSGSVWLDANKNGGKDSGEAPITSIKVQLLKSGTMIKATTTDGNGKYEFSDLEKGSYSVKYIYDGDNYTTTLYKAVNIAEEDNSEAIESESGIAVSNNIEISNSDITNVNVGLIKRDIFNLSINKYVTKTIVKTNKREEIYDYENLQLGKVEIKAKELNNAKVTIEYLIEVENTGEIEGNATTIIDYIPKGMEFDQEKNPGWYLGEDGNAYNDTLREVVIKPGEKKELKISLTKQMSEDNTGVVSNKVIISGTENKKGIEDNKEDSTNTQEMLVMISTGSTVRTVITTILTVMIIALIVINLKPDNINRLKNFSLKKIYR